MKQTCIIWQEHKTILNVVNCKNKWFVNIQKFLIIGDIWCHILKQASSSEKYFYVQLIEKILSLNMINILQACLKSCSWRNIDYKQYKFPLVLKCSTLILNVAVFTFEKLANFTWTFDGYTDHIFKEFNWYHTSLILIVNS